MSSSSLSCYRSKAPAPFEETMFLLLRPPELAVPSFPLHTPSMAAESCRVGVASREYGGASEGRERTLCSA